MHSISYKQNKEDQKLSQEWIWLVYSNNYIFPTFGPSVHTAQENQHRLIKCLLEWGALKSSSHWGTTREASHADAYSAFAFTCVVMLTSFLWGSAERHMVKISYISTNKWEVNPLTLVWSWWQSATARQWITEVLLNQGSDFLKDQFRSLSSPHLFQGRWQIYEK